MAPSPWRLLRALLATGYTALNWEGDLSQPMHSAPPEEARILILKLASTLPTYRLPEAVGSHTRHYMPLGVLDKGREETTLVFDTWAKVGDGILGITWDVSLTAEEARLLAQLAEQMGYLGRSESWVDAHLAQSDETPSEGADCFPEEGHVNPGSGWEQVPLLAPDPEYLTWRERQVKALLDQLPPIPLPEKKRLTKKDRKPTEARELERAEIQGSYPADLIACLQTDTTELRRHGWSQPPGSRRVFYRRKTDALDVSAPRPRRRTIPTVEAMLLSIATASGNDHALPHITRTLPQAELLHTELVGKAARKSGHSEVLSGCDEQRQPLTGPHRHAHILPLDLDRDDHLEHILIWAPMGLDGNAQNAIRAARQTFTKGGVDPLKLALEVVGDLEDLRCLDERYREEIRALLGPAEGPSRWISRTPFVPPRYLKPRGRNSLEGQIAAELSSRNRPAPTMVRRLDPLESLRIRHFVRARRRGPSPSVDIGFAVEMQFDQPVQGLICLGYGSHFGLGLFACQE